MGGSGEPLGGLSASLGDPSQDAAGILGLECFLCGKQIVNPRSALLFGPASRHLSKLPCHRECLLASTDQRTIQEYQRRLADLVDIPRPA